MKKLLIISMVTILTMPLIGMDPVIPKEPQESPKPNLINTPKDSSDQSLVYGEHIKKDDERAKKYSDAIDELKWSLRNFDKDNVENGLVLLDHFSSVDSKWKKYNLHMLAVAQTARQRSKTLMKEYIRLHPNIYYTRADNRKDYATVIENAENAAYNEKIVIYYDEKITRRNNPR